MIQRYYDKSIECAPIDELIRIIENKITQTDVFTRAVRSPLYRDKWLAAGINPEAVKSYAELQKIPYTDSADLRVAQESNHPDEFICSSTKPRFWNSTSGSTGTPKWIPVGGEDRSDILKIAYRLSYFTDKRPMEEGDVGFGITAPAPFISDSSTWFGFIEELRGVGPQDLNSIESVIFSYEDGVAGISMAIKRKVTVFLAFPSLVMRIADGLSESAPKLAKQGLKEKFNLLNLLAYLITRVRKIRARDILKVHTGVFGGEPLEPYRKALHESWNLEHTYNLYSSTEFRLTFVECSEQNGMHVWLDACVPEIILQSELDRERDEDGYVPAAIPLWDSQPGDEGELVLTTFGQTFPLVRYRTSDMIHIVSIAPCPCGRTHPRINILQRSDDLVNLGVIRFSTFAIKEELEKITQPSSVSQWQVRVSRVDYKPLLTVIVCPNDQVDEAEMTANVRAALENIEALRLGWENELIFEPTIKIDPELGVRTSSSGKFRPLVYEEEAEVVS